MKITGIAAKVFNMKILDDDGDGVTESHLMEVLSEFVAVRDRTDASAAMGAVPIRTDG